MINFQQPMAQKRHNESVRQNQNKFQRINRFRQQHNFEIPQSECSFNRNLCDTHLDNSSNSVDLCENHIEDEINFLDMGPPSSHISNEQ